MQFHHIDLATWSRREIFEHFIKQQTTYSLTRRLDITALKAAVETSQTKLYPALIYAIVQVVNANPQFRLGLDDHGQLGYWDRLDPLYTVQGRDVHQFTGIVTPVTADLAAFHAAYLADVARYQDSGHLFPQADQPANLVNISMIPWTDFTAFHLNNGNNANYLLPIVTLGQYQRTTDRLTLPVALQVHHAAVDGYDAAWFFNQLQAICDQLAQTLTTTENRTG